MPKLGLPCLLNFADQAGWAKLGRRGGLSDQKTEMCFIIRVEKLSFWESARKIHDIAGTPTLHPWTGVVYQGLIYLQIEV